jgi:hypothetical protein
MLKSLFLYYIELQSLLKSRAPNLRMMKLQNLRIIEKKRQRNYLKSQIEKGQGEAKVISGII